MKILKLKCENCGASEQLYMGENARQLSVRICPRCGKKMSEIQVTDATVTKQLKLLEE